MASEKRRTPWNEIHRPLDRALAACGLSPCEQVIMQHAREMCYATAKAHRRDDPLPFRLNQQEFALRVGLTREKVNRAYRRLIGSKLLIQSDGLVVVNKHYRTWMPPHRLCPQQLVHADAGLFWSPSDPAGRCDQSVTPTVTNRSLDCDQSVTPTVTNRSHHPSKEGRASGRASSEREERVFLRGESVRGEAQKKKGSRSFGFETPDPDPDPDPDPIAEPEPFSPEWIKRHGHAYPETGRR